MSHCVTNYQKGLNNWYELNLNKKYYTKHFNKYFNEFNQIQ